MNATTIDNMNPDFDQLGKLLGGAAAALIAGWLMLRKWLSRDKFERAGDEAGIGVISRLNKLLDEERKARREAEARADMFAKERNDAVKEIGELRGQVQSLTFQVVEMRKQLENYVKSH